MKIGVVGIDQDSGEHTLEYDEEAKVKLLSLGADWLLLQGLFNLTADEFVQACEYYAKDRDERLKAYEAITTMTEYWEEPK